jgi:pimeloyl-ACP methyl ester carboxylesterase
MNTIWLDLLGAEVRYRGREFTTRTIEMGRENPDKLVLIHGVGGHAEAYARNLRRLGENHHAIAIDLLWHGLSAKPPFTVDMVPMYARQYLDLLDDLGVEKAAIEGESLGGWVALWTALHHPERVSKIILNTTAGIRWNRDKVKIDEASGTNLLRERSLLAINNPTRETIQKRLEWLMASPDRVTEELIDLRYAIYTRPDTNASLKEVFANSFQRGPDARHFIDEDQLATLTVPAFALWSDKNPGAGADVGERLASLIPGSSHYCIRDAGHWPQWEQAEDHDRVVKAFLAGKPIEAPVGAPA